MLSTESIIPRNPLSNKCSFYFCAIHLLPAEEGEFFLYYVKTSVQPRLNNDLLESSTFFKPY